MPKIARNLPLDEDAIRRAEEYSARHNTSVSALVNEFLRRLPLEPTDRFSEHELSPTVRRLLGAATGKHGVSDYHDHLAEKYG